MLKYLFNKAYRTASDKNFDPNKQVRLLGAWARSYKNSAVKKALEGRDVDPDVLEQVVIQTPPENKTLKSWLLQHPSVYKNPEKFTGYIKAVLDVSYDPDPLNALLDRDDVPPEVLAELFPDFITYHDTDFKVDLDRFLSHPNFNVRFLEDYVVATYMENAADDLACKFFRPDKYIDPAFLKTSMKKANAVFVAGDIQRLSGGTVIKHVRLRYEVLKSIVHHPDFNPDMCLDEVTTLVHRKRDMRPRLFRQGVWRIQDELTIGRDVDLCAKMDELVIDALFLDNKSTNATESTKRKVLNAALQTLDEGLCIKILDTIQDPAFVKWDLIYEIYACGLHSFGHEMLHVCPYPPDQDVLEDIIKMVYARGDMESFDILKSYCQDKGITVFDVNRRAEPAAAPDEDGDAGDLSRIVNAVAAEIDDAGARVDQAEHLRVLTDLIRQSDQKDDRAFMHIIQNVMIDRNYNPNDLGLLTLCAVTCGDSEIAALLISHPKLDKANEHVQMVLDLIQSNTQIKMATNWTVFHENYEANDNHKIREALKDGAGPDNNLDDLEPNLY